MKLIKQYSKIFMCAACVAMLAACDGANEEQDGIALSTSNELPEIDNSIVISGLTMNGYLANALVWIDVRKNDTIDGFEPFAYTDNEGYFSYNPNTGVNYCASSDQSQQRFCLKTGIQSGDIVIKAAKGIELLSGEAFRAVLTASTSIEQAQSNLQTLMDIGVKPPGAVGTWQTQVDPALLKLSPLSSVDHYLPANSDLVSALSSLGFNLPNNIDTADILAIDYIAGIEQQDNLQLSGELFAAALTISRLVDTLTVNLDQAADDLDFGLDGLPMSSADAVYQGLATSLVNNANPSSNSTNSLNKTVSNKSVKQKESSLSDTMLAAAVNNLKTVLGTYNAMPSNVQQILDNTAGNAALGDLLGSISSIANNHFATIDTNVISPSAFFTLNQTITLPTLTKPIAFASAQEANAISRVARFISEPNNRISTLLTQATETMVSNQGQNRTVSLGIDLTSLTQDLIEIAKQTDGESALEDPNVAVTLTELAQVETADNSSFWTGNRLSLSGFQNGDEQGQVQMFFDGDSSATSGELIMCVAYRNDTKPSDNIAGKRFQGTWSVISGNSQNRLSLVAEGFTIQMKVLGESLGSDIADDQQIPSLPRMNNESYGKFGFTLNEDTATWHSDDASVNQNYGLMYADSIPSSNADCKNILSLAVE